MTRPLATGAYFPYEGSLVDLSGTYAPQGADIATIRRYGGKFGRSAAVEIGITNLQLQVDFETGIRGFDSTGDNHIGGTLLADGFRRIPRFGTTSDQSQIYVNASYSVAAGDRYTESIVFRVDGSGVPGLAFNFFTNNGNHFITATIIDLGGGVYRAAATYVIEGGGTALRLINLANIAWNAGSTHIDLLEPLCFKHVGVEAGVTEPIFQSHCWGTRASGGLRYGLALLPKSKGTLSVWVRPNYDWKNFPSADYHHILATYINNGENALLRAIQGGSADLQFTMAGGGSAQFSLTYIPPNWSPNKLHHIAITWSDTEQVLYYDGVRRATHSGNFTRWADATWIGIGAFNGSAGGNTIAGTMDDLAIIDRQLTDAQIADLFALNAPFVGESSLGASAEKAEFVHLIEMQFSSGTVYLNTGAQDISWGGQLWEAVGGLLTIGGVESSGDSAAQGVELKLSGVDQSVLGALMTNNYRGRIVRVRRAYLDQTTGVVRNDPVFLFEGLQLSPYSIEEERSRQGGTVTVTTRIMGYLGVDRIAGIWANLTSHQHYFPGDTFFQHVASLANLKLYWGTQAPLGVGAPGVGAQPNPQDPGDQGFDSGWT